MEISQLENIHKNSLKAQKKQKKYVSRLYKKEKKMLFNSLNGSVVSDNRKFWKTVKPFLPIKEIIVIK